VIETSTRIPASTPRVRVSASGRIRLPAGPGAVAACLLLAVGWSGSALAAEEIPPDSLEITELEEVVVRARRAPEDALPATERVDVETVRSGAGTFATDPLRALQGLPGTFGGNDDYSDGYVVRGGDPEENLVRVDGFRLLQPVHLGGFVSVIPDDVVRGVTLHRGAAPPHLGDAVSSVADLSLVRPERHAGFFRYDVGAMTLGAHAVHDSAHVTALLRSSFYDLILGAPPEVDERSFQDGLLRARLRSSRGRLDLLGVGTHDRETDLRRVGSGLVGLRWSDDVSLGTVGIATSVARRDRDPEGASALDPLRVDRVTVGADLVRPGPQATELRVDAALVHERIDAAGARFAATGGFTSTELVLEHPRARLSAGGRLERIPLTDGVHVAPYASAAVPLVPRVTLGGAVRVVRQSPFGLLGEPDVGGIPISTRALLDAGADAVEPVRVTHVSASTTIELTPRTAISLELYQKRYASLLTWDDPGAGPTPEDLRGDGDGEGEGIEVVLRRAAASGVVGELSWTRAVTTKREGAAPVRRPSDFDRRTVAHAQLTIPLSEEATLGIGYRYGTGRPYTPFRDDGTEVVPGEINAGRLPDYARLDLKLSLRVPMTVGRGFLYLDVLNLTNRDNVVERLYFDEGGELRPGFRGGLPLTPMAGFGLTF